MMKMMRPRKAHLNQQYYVARIVIALCCIFTGYQMILESKDYFIPLLHGWRTLILPASENRISADLTYD